jgi:hypothetical protein
MDSQQWTKGFLFSSIISHDPIPNAAPIHLPYQLFKKLMKSKEHLLH